MHRILLFVTIVACLAPGCKEKNRTTTAQSNSALYSPTIRPLTEAIAKDTNNGDAWFRRGLALHKIEIDSLALNDWYKAYSKDTTRAEYASAIGDLLFEHKDIATATVWLARAMRHNPNDPKAHLKIAKLMLFTREHGKAFTEINTVLRQDAFNPEAYFLKGLVYKDMKDTNKAISSFQTVLNVAPDYREAAIQLGQLYAQRGSPLGLQYYENAYKLDTTDVFPLYARGMYYQQKGDFEAAKAQYTRCILQNTQYGDAYFANGYILLQQDSLEKARRQFEHVTRIDPTNPKAYYNRGLCSELMGDKASAIADYKQALTFDKDYTTASEGIKRIGDK
jgi:tetratricopeptide (TPR) repeat protein